MDEYVAFYMEWIVEQSHGSGKCRNLRFLLGCGAKPRRSVRSFTADSAFGENCLRDEPENRIDGGFNRRSADERTVKRFQLPVWAAEQADGELAETIYEGPHVRRGEVNDQHEQNLRDELQREKREDARQLAGAG